MGNHVRYLGKEGKGDPITEGIRREGLSRKRSRGRSEKAEIPCEASSLECREAGKAHVGERRVRGGGVRVGSRKRLIIVSVAELACLPRVGGANNCPGMTLVLVWLGAKNIMATQFSVSVSTAIYCTSAMSGTFTAP